MKDNVIDIEVYIKAIENHHFKDRKIKREYLIGGKLEGEEFEKLLNEHEYGNGKFSTPLFGEKVIRNNGCNIKTPKNGGIKLRRHYSWHLSMQYARGG